MAKPTVDFLIDEVLMHDHASGLSGYVPYTGANADVNLNSKNLLTTGTIYASIFQAAANTNMDIKGGSNRDVRLVPSMNNGVYFMNSGNDVTKFGYAEYWDMVYSFVPMLIGNNLQLYFGDSANAAIYYDETNLVIDPKEVGSGVVSLNGGSLTTTGTLGAGAISYDNADWTGGNVIYVPLTKAGKTQTEILNEAIAAATAGDTLILASGTYTVTANIVVNKSLGIIGQKSATIINSSTNSVQNIRITASNVLIANLSITHSGTASYGIHIFGALVGISIQNVSITGTGSGSKFGIYSLGSDINIFNCFINETSTDNSAHGIWVSNSGTVVDNIINITNTVSSISSAGAEGFAYRESNIVEAQNITLNLYNCVGKAVGGTNSNGLFVTSTVTNNAICNANWTCYFSGDTADVRQTGSNVCNLNGCVLGNNTTSGTVNYLGTFVGGGLSLGAGNILTTGTLGAGAITGTGYLISGGTHTAGKFLRSDGTNCKLSTLLLPNSLTQYYIPYADVANSLGVGSAKFTFNGSTLAVGSAATDKIYLYNPTLATYDTPDFSIASPFIEFKSSNWDDDEEENTNNNWKIYGKGTTDIYGDAAVSSLVVENADSAVVNTRFSSGGNNVVSSGELIVHNSYAGSSVWLDLPVGAGSQSGVGFGGYGRNPFFAYCGADSYWFQGAAYQDVAYRNTQGRLLFGNDPSYNEIIRIDKAPSRAVNVSTTMLGVYSTYGVMGAEKINNPSFATGTTSWTLGAAWQWVDATDNVQKFQDGVTTLSQTSAAMVTPLVVGKSYKLGYALSSVIGGGVTPSIGGVTLPYRSGAGTFYETFTAISTASLVFTPDNASRFYIDNITLWEITEGDLGVAGNAYIGGALQHYGTTIGFFGVTATTRQTELTDELTTITHTAPGVPDYAIQDLTNSSGYGFVTKDEGNSVLAVIANLQTRVNELETKLTAYGLLQDAD
jgi:hypothetical protein